MDNDQRDRREWPEPDRTPDEPAAGSTDPDRYPTDPDASGTTGGEWGSTDTPAGSRDASYAPSEASPSAAEIESWPSQDVTSSSTYGEPRRSDEGWPTEPPAAGSGTTETWPTSAPERGDEPVSTASTWEASPTETPSPTVASAAHEPPPGEVEAYAAGTRSDSDLPPVAAAAAAQGASGTDAATGESTQCPRCGTENRPGLAFCRNCGQRLVAAGVSTTVERPGAPEGTQACPRCGTHNRAGVAFCQNCGANLRGTAPGYVPPAAVADAEAPAVTTERRGAVLGPVVLLIGVVGLITAYLLPFLYGNGSLFERAFGSDGYGAAFWSGYPEVEANLADQAYFGLAAPVPILAALLVLLAGAGFVRARPGALQTIGLAIALLWSVGLIVLFIVVEVLGNLGGDLLALLRGLSPAGIIFFLASLIVLIGTLTRFGRS